LQPFEFYSSILCEMDGWRKILSRLGTDAADPVEEFLNAALDFGRSQTPSLEAFLHAIETTDSELKRDQDRSEGAVRVLTVHASKGLEAPVVILPDTWTTPQNGKFDKVLLRAGDVPLWKVSTGQDDPVRAMARQQDQIERMREYQRLLYVALTRARDQLHVCGYEGKKAPDDQRWYRIVEDAMDRLGARSVEAYGDTIKRLGELPAPVTAPDVIVRKALVPAKPDWVQQAAQPESVIEQVAPSRAGVKLRSSSPGGKGEGALERGLAVHRILDRIAQAAPDSFGSIATNVALSLIDDTQAVQAVVREALAVRREPSFAHLFGPGSHGELPVRGIVSWRGGKVELSARIDRVLVTATDVTIIEFKTDRVVPQAISAIPSNYITQLALYRRALSAMFPGRSVACGIIWTVQPVLTLIPPEHLHDVERVLDPPVHAS
jgi:ATP-dependent helicase/nuclease subunit A